MRHASPPVPGAALGERGCARRFACGDAELWRIDASVSERSAESSRAELGERLLALGQRGVGGFVDGGIDAEGVWLVRALPPSTLSALRKTQTISPRRALNVLRAAANALAACEDASLFAGRLTPETLLVALAADDPERAHVCVPAETLVSALVGAGGATTSHTASPKELLWAPPELAAGAGWDSAANRYALGVIAYELFAGAHPFGGAGLRHALREAGTVEAAPFVESVARELPPGVQSLCLRMIHPDRRERPVSAAAIVGELESLTSPFGRERRSRSRRDEEEAEPAPKVRRTPKRPRGPIGLAELGRLLVTSKLRYAPLAFGLTACAVAVAFAMARPEERPRTPSTAGSAQPVASRDTLSGDCASCHPRHAAEWSQSAMAHAVKSPLFNSLEALIQEQVGRDNDCPNGAGILRRAGSDVCRDRGSGLAVTGSGGEHWCVNCHSPADNLGSTMPAWQGRSGGDPRSILPVRDMLSERAMEGISCAFCHQVHGPVGPGAAYQGNPSWTSFVTGAVFRSRPEDGRGLLGIANSGYLLDPRELLLEGNTDPDRLATVGDDFVAHVRPTPEAKRYLASAQFCGSCHDVRLFGTDVLGVQQRGEHFKRLRNAYSEWADWAATERTAGKEPATCQGCHMSTYPGVCVKGKRDKDSLLDDACPKGYRFEARDPGERVSGRMASSSTEASAISPHYFSAIDVPLARELGEDGFDQPGLDASGIPLSFKKRRDLLLRRSMRFELAEARRVGGRLEVPLDVENVGAGHKVPAGFSQEREIWVHLRVEDAAGTVLYEVGRTDRDDEDLRDKVFVSVNTDPDRVDGQGRPQGLFGADVIDGPDVPRWTPAPDSGASEHRGRGLVNFQNGFLRCVRCLGEVSPSGECLAGNLLRHRAERFDDGDYDIDTGECRSNLSGRAALFEIYFPVGALDADTGVVRGPDAIIDTRALSPGRPVRYIYELDTQGRSGPFRITAKLMFRSFPPYLVRAFAEYEAKMAARGRRPSGPLVSFDMLRRLERVELARRSLIVP